MNPTETYRIFGWKADNDGCGFYRVQQPIDALAERGHEATANVTMPVEAFQTSAVFIGQKVIKDEPIKIWQELRRQGNSLLVYEIDDDLTTIHPSNERAHKAFMNPHMRRNFMTAIKAAHVVTVTTPHLAGVVRRWNKNVVVIPNTIREKWLQVPVQRRESPVIGWAGSDTHIHDFQQESAGLRAFFAEHDVPYLSIGADFSPLVGARTVTVQNGREIEAYYPLLQQMDVGLAIVTRTLFNAAKSPIKALEYAMFGIPTVASDSITYRDFVEHGVTGFLAQSPAEWTEYLNLLASDAGLREAMGDAARDKAKGFTIEANVHRYEDVIEANFR
jgi:hypothetical protein